MNTLLPTDYVGKEHAKMGQIIESIHRSISRKQAARPDSRVTQGQPGVAVEATIQEWVNTELDIDELDNDIAEIEAENKTEEEAECIGEKQRINVEIRFSNILNVLVPNDLIGKANNKTFGVVGSIAEGMPIFDAIKNANWEHQFFPSPGYFYSF